MAYILDPYSTVHVTQGVVSVLSVFGYTDQFYIEAGRFTYSMYRL